LCFVVIDMERSPRELLQAIKGYVMDLKASVDPNIGVGDMGTANLLTFKSHKPLREVFMAKFKYSSDEDAYAFFMNLRAKLKLADNMATTLNITCTRDNIKRVNIQVLHINEATKISENAFYWQNSVQGVLPLYPLYGFLGVMLSFCIIALCEE
jgi:hypothetical protein